MTDFSKKTGDYSSLSAVDLRVLALVYQLEKQHVGTEHIRTEPMKKVMTLTLQKLLTEKSLVLRDHSCHEILSPHFLLF